MIKTESLNYSFQRAFDDRSNENTLTASGQLRGYCAQCGMMLIKHERKCPKCECPDIVPNPPEPAGNILAFGITPFTRYSPGMEVL